MSDQSFPSTELFQRALQLHQSGNLSQAHDLYHQHLSSFPEDPKGWYFSGAVAFELGDLLGASNSFRRASELDSSNAVFRFNLAISLFQLDRLDEAEEETRKVLELKTDYPRAWNLLGVFQLKKGQYTDSKSSFENASRLAPDLVEAKINLGKTLIHLKEFDQARKCLDQAALLNPAHIGLDLALGDLFLKLKKPQKALEHYEREKSRNPEHSELWNQMGLAYLELTRRVECKECFEKALDLDPGNPQTLNNLGLCLQQLGRYEEAVEAYRLALTREESYPDPYNNLGSLHLSLGNLEKARKLIQQAIALNPDFLEAWINLGNCHRENGEFEEAENCYSRVLEIKPDHPTCLWNRSLLELMHGNYLDGFAGFESRTRVSGLRLLRYEGEIPTWDGALNREKTLYIYADQGFGDSLQFFRFLERARKLVKKLWFQCHPSLVQLLEGILDIQVLGTDQPIPDADFQLPLSSLPHLFQIELSSLPAPPEFDAKRWSELPSHLDQLLKTRTRHFRIGLCWAGNPAHSRDFLRTIPPQELEPLLNLENTSLFSLQVGDAYPALPPSMQQKITDLSGELHSFFHTALAISKLDLVISVDTSVAHLGGTLGKPTWILLPKIPDWRWMLDRDDSPWYPSARLFRQKNAGDWSSVTSAVHTVLNEVLNGFR